MSLVILLTENDPALERHIRDFLVPDRIDLKFEYGNEYEANRVLFDRLENGILPDIIQLGNANIPYLITKGVLMDLSSFGAPDGFDPKSWALFNWDGVQSGIPASTTTKGMFYNKSWFRKAELPYPTDEWTWDQFVGITKRLHEANVSEPGMFGAHISFHYEYLESILALHGARWLSPCGRKASGYANSPATVEVLGWLVDLVHNHQILKPTMGYFDTRGFSRGNIGMTLEYYLPLFELEPALRDNLGVVGLPRHKGEKKTLPTVGGFGISSHCRTPETAWELVTKLCGGDNPYTRFVTLGGTPSHRVLLEDKKYFTDPNRKAIYKELQLAVKDYYPVDPVGNPIKFLQELINPEIEEILLHGAEIQPTLDHLAVKLDRTLEERWS